MKKQVILSKVFWLSNALVISVVLLLCLLYGWDMDSMLYALLVSFTITAPAVLSLQVFFWLKKHVRFQTSVFWMVLLSSIPLLAIVPAYLLREPLPGDLLFLLVLGMIGSYTGIISHAEPIARLIGKDEEGQ